MNTYRSNYNLAETEEETLGTNTTNEEILAVGKQIDRDSFKVRGVKSSS